MEASSCGRLEPDDAPVIRNLVGEFRGRQVGGLPQFPERSREGGVGGLFDAGARLRRQGIFLEKVLPEALCGKVSHRIHNANLVTGMQQHSRCDGNAFALDLFSSKNIIVTQTFERPHHGGSGVFSSSQRW